MEGVVGVFLGHSLRRLPLSCTLVHERGLHGNVTASSGCAWQRCVVAATCGPAPLVSAGARMRAPPHGGCIAQAPLLGSCIAWAVHGAVASRGPNYLGCIERALPLGGYIARVRSVLECAHVQGSARVSELIQLLAASALARQISSAVALLRPCWLLLTVLRANGCPSHLCTVLVFAWLCAACANEIVAGRVEDLQQGNNKNLVVWLPCLLALFCWLC